jgi:hypothetical protein
LSSQETAFFQDVQANMFVSESIRGIPIYRFKMENKKFINHFEMHLYEYKGVKSDYYDLMIGKSIPFIKNFFGKPSKEGNGYLDYYLQKDCIQWIIHCNKMVFKIDTITQKIIKMEFASPLYFSH